MEEIKPKDALMNAVVTISDNLILLDELLHRNLSEDYISFDIQLGDQLYSFHPPSTMKEAELMEEDRKRLVYELIKDALSSIIFRYGVHPVGSELWHKTWDRLLCFRVQGKQKFQSPIEPDSYEEIKQFAHESMKALNTETYTGTMERSDLTDEQRQEKLNDLAEKGLVNGA